MNFGNALKVLAAFGMATAFANAGSITFVCAANVDAAQAGTCSYLNTAVASDYNNTFTNVNATVYIQMGTTGLASSTSGFFNFLSYNTFVTDLTANATASGDPIMNSAVASLNTVVAGSQYANDSISITQAEGQALGVPLASLKGTTSGGAQCTMNQAGCYAGIITMTNTPGTFYYDQNGGAIGAGPYDFYGTTEHEFDELLGTPSCVTTTAILEDECDAQPGANGKTGTPSSADLFRYNNEGTLAFNSNYINDDEAPAGAYFSYDGGETNGANGFVYNTDANGEDYADYVSSCPGGPFSVQDAEGCPGKEQGQTIRNDGGAEINTLNALGYEMATPEPGTMGLFGLGTALLVAWRRRRA